MFKGFFCILLFSFQLLAVTPSYSQNFEDVDLIVDNYPKTIQNTDEIITLINNDFSKPELKARAIFRWVATTIGYDLEASLTMDGSEKAFSYTSESEKNIKEQKFKATLIAKALASKKALCHGYAAIIENLCTKVGLESKVILGNLKSSPEEIGNSSMPLNHAWNVVKVNGTWHFIDATLAAGFISANTDQFKFYFNDGYFFTPPERFFLNHFPSDINWLLVSKTKEEYIQLPLYMGNFLQFNYEIVKPNSGVHSTKNDGNFVFSIKGLEQYDSVSYLLSSEPKIQDFDQEDNTKDFTVVLNNKQDQYISIYVNRKLIVFYKII